MGRLNGFQTVLLMIVLALVFVIPASAQKVNAFPKDDDPLHVRVAMYDELMRGNHWNEGAIMQHVIFPPVGKETPIVGSQEDVAGHTAVFLAAYSYRYAVTKDPKVREWANQLMEGLLKLEKVTGVPGVVARSFNKTDKPLWHEQTYFFPMEWHQSTSMPGYRWQGDLSSDKFTDFLYGVGTFWEICADAEYKAKAAGFLDRFMGRCVDYNFKMVDVDNKMTLWGNFCPDLPHQSLNSLEMLAGMKVTYRVTGKERYRAAYQMLIDRYHYDDDAIMAKVLWPDEWKTPWDDHLAAKSFDMLMRWEDDPLLKIKYRMSLNRHWHDWKNSDFRNSADVFYHMLYQVLTGETVVGEKCIAAIKQMPGFKRQRLTYTIPTENGMKTMEADEEGNATTMIRNYWFGRYHGFIDPKW
ncbi:MAG: hypothetical protein E4H13_03460 [Calditrichales bacterium]|nr:MAG: hypothetical protein E4H13_03460 [Calditrichales bacterium]